MTALLNFWRRTPKNHRPCNKLEERLVAAVQCMNEQSERSAARRMAQNIENIKNSVPISDGASKRLVLSKKCVDGADRVFGR